MWGCKTLLFPARLPVVFCLFCFCSLGVCVYVCVCLVEWHSWWDLSSPTRDRTCATCIGSAESEPLEHQGSPLLGFLKHGATLTSRLGDLDLPGKQRGG